MKRLWLLMMLVLNGSAVEQTNKTVFPPGLENQNGNAGDSTFSGGVPQYQELFRASALATTWQTPVKITSVAFRVAEGGNQSFDAVVPRVEIRFSTTLRPPEEMSTIYSINKGADEKTVFNHSNVRIMATGDQPVNPFEVRFSFAEPFVYDPSQGHLLMYLAHDSPTLPSDRGIDAHSFGELDESSPFASYGGGGFVSPTAYGLVTQFEWVAIPEPQLIPLISVGLFVMMAVKFKKK